MLWVKAFHIIAMVCWFAGLFYLPRLYVYHAMSKDQTSIERFKIMERKLYRGIATPAMALTLILGFWIVGYQPEYYAQSAWFHAKLTLVLLLVIYHFYCGHLRTVFAEDRNTRTHVWYRWFNEVPVVLLIAIIILVVVKPF